MMRDPIPWNEIFNVIEFRNNIWDQQERRVFITRLDLRPGESHYYVWDRGSHSLQRVKWARLGREHAIKMANEMVSDVLALEHCGQKIWSRATEDMSEEETTKIFGNTLDL